MNQQLLQQILEKLNRMDNEQQEMKQGLQEVQIQMKQGLRETQDHMKQGLRETQDHMKQGLQEIQVQMKQEFTEVKDQLRIIKDQTASNSELSSPINDLQEQVKNHDADIKLIKRLLVN